MATTAMDRAAALAPRAVTRATGESRAVRWTLISIALAFLTFTLLLPLALVFTQALEAFMTRIKVAAYGGFVVASPVVFFHLWRFITPGLNPKEKRYAIPFVTASSGP